MAKFAAIQFVISEILDPKDITYQLKTLSDNMGFIACGVSQARRLDEEEQNLRTWLSRGYHATMGYMENHFEKRLDPRQLVPGASSVISFLYNYYPSEKQNPNAPQIAKYAYGEDYHKVIKDKLFELIAQLQEKTGPFNFRVFVDSAPIMERQWAALSGLGWIGKNSLLLRKGIGSYFFIGNIVCDLNLETDTPTTDHCGSCTKCIDACPTQAIVEDGVIDAARCISFLTIESKESIPPAFENKMENLVFGCDICQEVCPWNSFSLPHQEPRFEPKEWIHWNKEHWFALDEPTFLEYFSHSAITRAGFEKLKANIRFV